MGPQDNGGRGRPPAMEREDRERLILNAAEALFGSRGYRNTSVELIARACGMSRKTIYALFGSKECLYGALVARAVPIIPAEEPYLRDSFEASLVALMDLVIDAALTERQVAMLRLITAELPLAPELAGAYTTGTNNRGRTFLAATVRRLAERFRLVTDECYERLADILYGGVVALSLLHRIAGDDATLSDAETRLRARAVAKAVTSLMRPLA